MPIPRLRRIRSDDDTLRQVQDASDAIFQIIATKPILDGRLIQNVTVNTQATVNHGLSRQLIGWLIVRKRNSEGVWDTQDSNPTPSSTLTLESSGSTTIDLWVF